MYVRVPPLVNGLPRLRPLFGSEGPSATNMCLPSTPRAPFSTLIGGHVREEEPQSQSK